MNIYLIVKKLIYYEYIENITFNYMNLNFFSLQY